MDAAFWGRMRPDVALKPTETLSDAVRVTCSVYTVDETAVNCVDEIAFDEWVRPKSRTVSPERATDAVAVNVITLADVVEPLAPASHVMTIAGGVYEISSTFDARFWGTIPPDAAAT